MGYSYESCRESLANLAAWYKTVAASRNEATTRLHLIDQLFFECLAWSKFHTVVEEQYGGEYADYSFAVFRPVLIVEAKREGNYFELPAGVDRLEYSIPSLTRDYPSLKQALEQATGYCQRRGVPFGAVTNGHQMVAFVANRTDGIPPLEGRALVFASLDAMLDHFLDFWQALSKPGIEEKKLQFRLIGGSPEIPRKLSASLNNYPGLRRRGPLEVDLQILGDIVIEDIIRSPELEPRFLAECYCQSGALSQFALTSKAILQARYAALFEGSRDGPSTAPATTRNGISPELIASGLARRPILLLGDVGVGKTTFIRHLVNVEAAGIFKDAIAFHLDLGLQATLSADIKVFVVDEIERQLRELYGVDINERRFVRGVYDLDLKRFSSGIYGELRDTSPDIFGGRELDYLGDLISRKEQHLKRSLEHLSRGRRKQLVIFVDNADQRDELTQEQAFLIAQELAENWSVLVFVALRPETFHRSKKIGALTGYHAKAFTISPPRIDQVIQKRLQFALKITSGQVPVAVLNKNIVHLEKLPIVIEAVLNTLQNDDTLPELLDNISAGNVRLALDLIKAFIGNPHVKTRKILDTVEATGSCQIPLYEFLKAVIYGDAEYYDPGTSAVANLFDLSSLDPREHFILPLAVGVIFHSTGPEVKDGFVETSKVYERLQGIGFTPDQIDAAIARGCEKNLIETSGRRLPEPGQRMPSALRATPTGAYHIERLALQFEYLDAVLVDTPILDTHIRARITDVRGFNERLDRTETFASYLDSHWLAIEERATGFNWHGASQAIRRQIGGIRRSQEEIRNPAG